MDDSNNSGKIEKYTGAVTDECGANSCTTVNNAQNVYIFKSNDINNVIFQNFCWKIIRTTETGGVKLLYNGSPSSGKCTNTGANTMLSKTSFSQEFGYNQPAYVGYMYNPNTLNGTYEQQLRGDSTYAVNTNDSLLTVSLLGIFN